METACLQPLKRVCKYVTVGTVGTGTEGESYHTTPIGYQLDGGEQAEGLQIYGICSQSIIWGA